jgi:hypothetical protein
MIEQWVKIQSKARAISSRFAMFCSKTANFHDVFDDAFRQTIGRSPEFVDLMIDNAVTVYLSQGLSDSLLPGLRSFLEATGLYASRFIPQLIGVVASRLIPICDELYELPLPVYLAQSSAIMLDEMNYAERIVSPEFLPQVRSQLLGILFTARGDSILSQVPDLIEQGQIEAIASIIRVSREIDMMPSVMNTITAWISETVSRVLRSSEVLVPLLRLQTDLQSLSEFLRVCERRAIHSTLRSALNADAIVAARSLAHDAHRVFLSSVHNTEFSPSDIVPLVEMLVDYSEFELSHSILLIRRVMKGNFSLTADRMLVEALRANCGPGRTEKFDAILDDAQRSIDFNRFVASAGFRMRCIFLPQALFSNWKRHSLSPPRELKLALSMCEAQLRKEFEKRRFEWTYEMTSVTLKSRSLTVKCPGNFAILILGIGSSTRYIGDIVNTTGMDRNDVEAMVRMLTSPKCGELITVLSTVIRTGASSTRYCITRGLTGVIKIPVILSPGEIPTKTDGGVRENREMQIDCAVMAILKQCRVISRIELKGTLETKIGFTIEAKVFDARLKLLETKCLIAQQPDTNIAYVE